MNRVGAQEISWCDGAGALGIQMVHVCVSPYLAFRPTLVPARIIQSGFSFAVLSGQFSGCGYFDVFSDCAMRVARMNCLPGSLRPPGW